MPRPRVALGRFDSLEQAQAAQQRLAAAGLYADIASTRTHPDHPPSGFTLLIDPADTPRASPLLLPHEHTPNPILGQGETTLRIALAILAFLFALGLILGSWLH
ncbi:MAG: hypothetical protein KatS3mg108_3079 [Isosphaeraceae bacterium]|jgi:hypothetical protein|nr:MAG: hypothetical protein KatS3mg108_3079 [Isosphaeraceae bacterium]